jgi:4-amino-4-deoxy-L-arabinose transferase-like glycosyltransferase
MAIGAIARFLLAATVGLGVDESYAVAIARQFSLSYFDHPPLHFWITGAVAKLAGSEAPEVVRLPFVLCFVGTTWFTWRIAQRFFGDRAGLLAALLLNVSAVFSLSSGGWVLPDGPLMLLTTAAVDLVSRILFDNREGHRVADWLLAGALTGLAMLSKYHGVFVLAGTAAFIVSVPKHRKWLATPGPWLAAIVAFAIFSPVLLWNSEHNWVSFAFQGGRAAPSGEIHLDTFAANIVGQMAWVLPWIFIPLAMAAWRAFRAGRTNEHSWFLLCVAAGPIVAFTLVSLRGNVGLPHWQAPGWLFVFPLLGAAVATRLEAGSRAWARWLHWSVGGYVVLIALLTSHASTGWIARLAPKAFEQDPSGDLVTWRTLKPTLAQLGYFPSDIFVAATSWIQAGKAAVAMGPGTPVLCLCADPHHFFYAESDSAFLGRDAVLVKKRRENDDVLERFAPYFETLDVITAVPVYRGRQQVMIVDVYRGRRFRALYPTDQPR